LGACLLSGACGARRQALEAELDALQAAHDQVMAERDKAQEVAELGRARARRDALHVAGVVEALRAVESEHPVQVDLSDHRLEVRVERAPAADDGDERPVVEALHAVAAALANRGGEVWVRSTETTVGLDGPRDGMEADAPRGAVSPMAVWAAGHLVEGGLAQEQVHPSLASPTAEGQREAWTLRWLPPAGVAIPEQELVESIGASNGTDPDPK